MACASPGKPDRRRSHVLTLVMVLVVAFAAVRKASCHTRKSAQPAIPRSQAGILYSQSATPASPLVSLSPPHGLEVRCQGAERRLLRDAVDHRLDSHTLLVAALVAGGLSDGHAIAQYQRHYRAWLAEIVEQLPPNASAHVKAEHVLLALHRRRLVGGYHLLSNSPAEVFDSGRYNCVSATLLFNALLGELGVETACAELPGHVHSIVRCPEGPLEVETTCPTWFELLENPAAQQQWLASQAPPAIGEGFKDAPKREVSNVVLLAMIYYNRGVEQLRLGQFAGAVELNYKALWLDPPREQAAGNLIAAINNWAINRAAEGDLVAALSLLQKALLIAPEHAPLASNYGALCGRRVDELIEEGRIKAAGSLLDKAETRCGRQPWFDVIRATVNGHLESESRRQRDRPGR